MEHLALMRCVILAETVLLTFGFRFPEKQLIATCRVELNNRHTFVVEVAENQYILNVV